MHLIKHPSLRGCDHEHSSYLKCGLPTDVASISVRFSGFEQASCEVRVLMGNALYLYPASNSLSKFLGIEGY